MIRDVDTFIVVCRENGRYVLTTREVFQSQGAAQVYADTCSASREAMVIPGDFRNLRIPPNESERPDPSDYKEKDSVYYEFDGKITRGHITTAKLLKLSKSNELWVVWHDREGMASLELVLKDMMLNRTILFIE